MNKQELTTVLAEQEEITKGKASAVINAVFDAIGDALKAGEEVTIHGFGKFSVSQRAAREGRNPRDGSPVKIKAKKAVKFKPQKALSDAVQG